jgi:hypothetical protein
MAGGEIPPHTWTRGNFLSSNAKQQIYQIVAVDFVPAKSTVKFSFFSELEK